MCAFANRTLYAHEYGTLYDHCPSNSEGDTSQKTGFTPNIPIIHDVVFSLLLGNTILTCLCKPRRRVEVGSVAHGTVEAGQRLLSIQGADVSALSYAEVLARIKATPRPLTLAFVRVATTQAPPTTPPSASNHVYHQAPVMPSDQPPPRLNVMQRKKWAKQHAHAHNSGSAEGPRNTGVRVQAPARSVHEARD